MAEDFECSGATPLAVDDDPSTGIGTSAPLKGFAAHPGYRQLMRRKEELARHHIAIPFFMPHDRINGSTLVHAGRECINFSGYNYLGLAGHPEVSQAAKDAIDQYGTSASASRIVSGQIPLHTQLERELSEFLGVDDCLVFVSGYGTNVTTIGHLFGRRDLVIHDALAHNSIITGCKLAEGKRYSFPHNDWDALEELLAAHRANHNRALIAIEAVYSMDGDVADLDRVLAIKRRYNAMLMVDEAHSLGILGASGRGIGEQFQIDRSEVDIWMGTLSKTCASCGGYIAGDEALIDYLRYSAPGFIYSVGLSPPDTAAALAALRILKREPQRVELLRQRSALFLELARAAGLNTGTSHGTPVIPLIVGNSLKCLLLSQRLLEHGVHVQPIVYPAVSEDSSRLRFFITAAHSEEQIRYAVQTLARESAALSELDALDGHDD